MSLYLPLSLSLFLHPTLFVSFSHWPATGSYWRPYLASLNDDRHYHQIWLVSERWDPLERGHNTCIHTTSTIHFCCWTAFSIFFTSKVVCICRLSQCGQIIDCKTKQKRTGAGVMSPRDFWRATLTWKTARRCPEYGKSGPLSRIRLPQLCLFQITHDTNDCPTEAHWPTDLHMEDFWEGWLVLVGAEIH